MKTFSLIDLSSQNNIAILLKDISVMLQNYSLYTQMHRNKNKHRKWLQLLLLKLKYFDFTSYFLLPDGYRDF